MMNTVAEVGRAGCLRALEGGFAGRVIVRGDAGYEAARTVFYGGLDRRPSAIVRPAHAADVAEVIRVAREHDVELAVRSGGHSVAGHSSTDGGLVLDLRDLRTMEIDVEGRTAWAGAGLTAGEYTRAAGEHGLVTGFGDHGSVGIGGITLGGGVGFLVRSHGLTADDLQAAELVTADGRILHVDAERQPDLFWAIRGGGGNFGVATRFRFRLHRLPAVVGGPLALPATPGVIASFFALAAEAPDELTTIAMVMKAPAMAFIPADHHGRPILFALMTYAGDAMSAATVLAPFRALASPVVDGVREVPYASLYRPEEDDFHPIMAHRSMFLDRVDRGTAETMLTHLEQGTAMMSAVQVRVLGGAMARVPADATAFAHRSRPLMATVGAMYTDAAAAAEHEAWVAALASALPSSDDGVYVNFLGDEGADAVRRAYPGTTWDRLVELKTRWDPANLFRLNQNIPPARQPA